MTLPNGVESARQFGDQHFLRHIAKDASWLPFNGGEARDAGVGEATRGIAEARVIRSSGSSALQFPPHEKELVFGFVLDGSAHLDFAGGHELNPADAFVIPPGEQWSVRNASDEFRLLHVTTSRLD
jgi:quercetin dioxygenase-like cupin family protein